MHKLEHNGTCTFHQKDDFKSLLTWEMYFIGRLAGFIFVVKAALSSHHNGLEKCDSFDKSLSPSWEAWIPF